MEATKSADDILGALRRAQESGEPLGEELQDLRGVKFTDADLSELDLTGCNFAGCEMSRANLSGVRCASANFDGATLYKAKLDNAEFLGTTFLEANLSECSAVKTGFGLTDLTKANFFNAHLEDSTLVDAQVRQADFRAAKMDPKTIKYRGERTRFCFLPLARVCQHGRFQDQLGDQMSSKVPELKVCMS